MRMLRRISGGIFILLLFAVSTQAQNIYTDRPTQTTASAIVPAGAFQIETGFYLSEFEANIPGNFISGLKFQNISLNNTLLRFGLSEKVELRFYQEMVKGRFVSDGVVTQDNPVSFAPTFFGLKYNILKGHPNWPDVGVLANIGGGVFDNTGNGLQSEIRLLIDGNLPGEVSLSSNIGLAFSNGFDDNSSLYTIVVSKALNSKLAAFVEAYGFFYSIGPTDHSMDAGLTYLLSSSTQIDFYGGTGFTSGSANVLVGFGFSKRFLKSDE